jgi:predicted amidohydrolase YtcJ
MTGLLVRRAEIDGRAVADVRIVGGTITAVAPYLAVRRGEDVIDAAGGALLPGLADHHLHLHAIAAAIRSVRCGPPAVTDPSSLAHALVDADADEHGWVRGIGYSEDVAGALDCAGVDRLHRVRPVRIQHRSGALWMLNSTATRLLGLEQADHPGIERDGTGRPTGRLWRADDWLRARTPGGAPPDLHGVGSRLARLGVTHVTDATPGLDNVALDAIADAMRRRALPQHVQLLGAPAGWRPPTCSHMPIVGPAKLVLADSKLLGLDDLVEWVRATHAQGRAIAVHCVTDAALILLLAALTQAGSRAGDRIEHASLVPASLVPRLRELQLTVITQPGFLADRGDDYLRDVPVVDQPDLYRVRSLLDGGVPCAMSSDAPYGPVDPWTVLHAAVHRRTPAGRVVNPDERIDPERALNACLGALARPGGPPRRVAPGAAADLVLLRAPRADVLAAPSADVVVATMIDGTVRWLRSDTG